MESKSKSILQLYHNVDTDTVVMPSLRIQFKGRLARHFKSTTHFSINVDLKLVDTCTTRSTIYSYAKARKWKACSKQPKRHSI